MEAFLSSTGAVAIAEIGDKTQLLAFILASRFRRPWLICLGILLATVVNHFGAAWLGQWLYGWSQQWLSGNALSYLLAGSFFAVAAWMLIPDNVEADESSLYRYGPLVATTVLFFLAEIGDKTQVATVLLAAKYSDFYWVVAGTTLGMMLANVPVIWAANYSADKLPMVWIHRISAALFVLFGIATLMNA
ncbi:TMEM165/GDT1 family protein [uncultured Ferrimonas sp.]|uniref:TMEM165/GDT1 family protein n=1 Tax=uncultured Ferrimonas sp. TaxID=432640 RepID=UPI0026105DDE|nr:TMEM165/GDT1 family protein [uncultured Ferrimonas sp.]